MREKKTDGAELHRDAPPPVDRRTGGIAQQVLDLQRAAGNAAVTRALRRASPDEPVVQRLKLRDLLRQATIDAINKPSEGKSTEGEPQPVETATIDAINKPSEGKSTEGEPQPVEMMEQIQAFHDVLVNPSQIVPHLAALDAKVGELLREEKAKEEAKEKAKEKAKEEGNEKAKGRYTRALRKALQEGEGWMPRPRQQTLGPAEPTAPPEVSSNDKVEKRRARKAYARIEVEHGTLSTPALVERLRETRPLKDVGAPIPHGEWAHRIQLWILGRLAGKRALQIYERLQLIDRDGDLNGDKNPAVWSWVLDIPGRAISREGRKGFDEELVGAAAPTRLTSGLTNVGPGVRFTSDGKPLMNLQRALLDRRLKRLVEARNRQASLIDAFKKAFEEEEEEEEVMKGLTSPSPEIGDRFAAALGALRTKKSDDLKEWGASRHYVAWMSRTDQELRTALKSMKGVLGPDQADILEVIKALEPLVPAENLNLDPSKRAAVVEALMANPKPVEKVVANPKAEETAVAKPKGLETEGANL